MGLSRVMKKDTLNNMEVKHKQTDKELIIYRDKWMVLSIILFMGLFSFIFGYVFAYVAYPKTFDRAFLYFGYGAMGLGVLILVGWLRSLVNLFKDDGLKIFVVSLDSVKINPTLNLKLIEYPYNQIKKIVICDKIVDFDSDGRYEAKMKIVVFFKNLPQSMSFLERAKKQLSRNKNNEWYSIIPFPKNLTGELKSLIEKYSKRPELIEIQAELDLT